MKYLVLECHPSFAVVLGEDGSFLRVANLQYEVGQTVTEVCPMRARKPHRSFSKAAYGMIACAACLCILFGSLWFTHFVPYASVYVSVNPQVRIDVNRQDTVIDLFAVNADGKALIDGYSHQKKPLETVLYDLLLRAVEQGYLTSGGDVTLTLDASDRWIASHEQPLQDHVDSCLHPLVSVTIDVTPMSPVPDRSPDWQHPTDGDSDYADSDYGPDAVPVTPQPQAEPTPVFKGDSGYNEYEDSDYDSDSGYDEDDEDDDDEDDD